MSTFHFKNRAYSLWWVWRTRKLPAKKNKFYSYYIPDMIMNHDNESSLFQTHRAWVSQGLSLSLNFSLGSIRVFSPPREGRREGQALVYYCLSRPGGLMLPDDNSNGLEIWEKIPYIWSRSLSRFFSHFATSEHLLLAYKNPQAFGSSRCAMRLVTPVGRVLFFFSFSFQQRPLESDQRVRKSGMSTLFPALLARNFTGEQTGKSSVWL